MICLLHTGGIMSKFTPPRICGWVAPRFEIVRDAFNDNFTRRHELGGACCVYRHGRPVVDLWGGIRNKQTGEPWVRDTMVVVHSASKGLAAMTMAVAHSRGWLDYEERIATYWPEFGQHGKDKITVRQLLAHQAGLFAIDEPVDRDMVADLDRFAVVLARQKPAWQPGTRQGYHGLTLGFYQNEILRRVDPRHRSLGQIFHEEIAVPLKLEAYINVPVDLPNSRLATLSMPSMFAVMINFPFKLAVSAINPHSNIARALSANPGTNVYLDSDRIYARNLEVPSGGAVCSARALAHAYGVFAGDGHEIGLKAETLALLAAPAVPSTAGGFYDECLKSEVKFSLGFMKPSDPGPFSVASGAAFGSPGTGGSLGYADPAAGVGYGYVTSQAGASVTGDPREIALRAAANAALALTRRVSRHAA
jgi:CubicO group peptidase (beta-lactamase class C family)